ncbi:MAG: hypothetical protein AAFV53_41210 [Myxococcota bacterium]
MDRRGVVSGPWWGRLCTVILGRTPRCLRDDEIPDAQALLYDVYFKEKGWDPPTPNPSNLRADHDRRRFEDDLTDGARWLGVFEGNTRLIGVIRVLSRNEMGRLELERYIQLPQSLTSDGEVIELNRLAIRPTSRSRLTIVLIHLLSGWLAGQLGAQRAVIALANKGTDVFVDAYGWRHVGLTFRYHPTDPQPVHVIRFESRDNRRIKMVARFLFYRLRRVYKEKLLKHRRRDLHEHHPLQQ